jgi:hypothetical protein
MATSSPLPAPSRTPPKYVPTLTQVVPAGQLPKPAPGVPVTSVASPVPPPALIPAPQLSAEQSLDLADKLHQELIAHARKHVDAQLQRRVREAVSSLALAHAQDMLNVMQPVIEETVAHVIDEAVGQALAEVLTKR